MSLMVIVFFIGYPVQAARSTAHIREQKDGIYFAVPLNTQTPEREVFIFFLSALVIGGNHLGIPNLEWVVVVVVV